VCVRERENVKIEKVRIPTRELGSRYKINIK
jgi:hypothetical protein